MLKTHTRVGARCCFVIPSSRDQEEGSTMRTCLWLCVWLGAVVVSHAITEREILVEFYQATGGDTWNANHGWAEDASDLCKWHGVICIGEEDQLELDSTARRHLVEEEYRVIGLNLKENNLVGRTPPSLYKLPLLQSLYLSYNENLDVTFLGGDFAKKLVQLKVHSTGITSVNGISNLQALETLHMSGDKLEDAQIPTEIFHLSNLKELHMAANQFQGTLPQDISNLSALQVLNLYNNNLGGTLPYSMANLNNLKILTLTGNKFTGTIPSYLQDLPQLQEVYLDRNQFNGPLPAFSALPNIRQVFVNDNFLTGTIPADFLAATNATKLRVDLNGNRLSGTIPATLNALQGKQLVLTLADNLLTDIDESLCNNTNWMQDNDVATSGCDAIACPVGYYNSLGRKTSKHSCNTCDSAIFVGQRYCLDTDDRGVLTALYTATNGEHWFSQDYWMTDTDVCEWFGVVCWDTNDNKKGRVRHLNLDDNNLKGTIPPSIFALDTLTTITVSRNKVVMRFDAIQQAPHMRKINIANTDTVLFDGIENATSFFAHLQADRLDIGGTIPSQILRMSNLQTLSMSDCSLEGTISSDIGNMRNLTNLYLHGNSLYGQIPTHVGNLNKLKVLSLAKNKLTGVIPGTMTQLTALQALSLNDQVTKGGGISGELLDFSSNTKLNTLYLGGNQFEGTIPANLLRGAELDSSLTVDLSSNVLTGTVPGALSRFANLNLVVHDNFISGIDQRLCVLDGWMNGNVRSYGCDAILCPASTTSSTGNRIFDNEECSVCNNQGNDGGSGSFYGQTSCGEREVALTEREILQQLYDATDGRNWHTNDNWYTNAHYCEWYGVTCDNAKSVVNIVLGSNKLQGTVPTAIYQLPNLKRLSLFSNKVEISFDGIDRARSLQSLILDSTGLTSLEGIGEARGLKELNVRFNELEGSIPTEIQRLAHLEAMELSNNNLSGPLPSWLGKLPSLDTFVVAKNQFSGPLLDFADNANLIFLDVSYNQLTGTVPATLMENSTAQEKIFIDLSNNHLSGTVPADLKRLERLQIHLQNNQITALADDLCKAKGWQDNDVEQYGCDAIVCPIGTYNAAGRQSFDGGECAFCKVAKYMGQTRCSGALRTMASLGTIVSLVVVSTVNLML